MLKLYAALVASALAVLLSTAHAQAKPGTTFVAKLSAENEVPGCPAGEASGARGVAIVRVDEETGTIRYRVVATRVPGTIAAMPGIHIHEGGAQEAGPVVAPLELTGRSRGLVAFGELTNSMLAAEIAADPADYYVNVHTTACPGGAVRGQLG
jgi:hypothetical protein